MTLIYPNEEYTDIYKKIVLSNRSRERSFLSEHALANTEGMRRKPEKIADRGNLRPAFFRDTDRIIHCNAYTRYIDKTQVFFFVENDHVTHRVLHVQLVSKIARTLGRFFRCNEDLIEAIALGHDLGHTPFGHAGEEFLAQILEAKGAGSFVHNAQSVRLLQTLERDGKGLNLTLHVLDGILGHNGELLRKQLKPADNLSWEKLDENLNSCFEKPRSERPEKKVFPSTLEGCIVRVADVFAYIGRDIEDAIELKVITREDLPKEAVEILGSTNRNIINNLTMDVTHNSYDTGMICFSDEVFEAMEALLKFNYKRIYQHPAIEKQQMKLKKIFTELFEFYLDELTSGRENSSIYKHFLSDFVSDYPEVTSKERIVADYMAGMTDRFLVGQYREHFLPVKVGGKGYEF